MTYPISRSELSELAYPVMIFEACSTMRTTQLSEPLASYALLLGAMGVPALRSEARKRWKLWPKAKVRPICFHDLRRTRPAC